MRQVFLSGFLSSFILLSGASLAQAADIGYDGYDENVYQDHAYIDKTLDDFEKRNGIYKGDKFQYEDNDYVEKNQGLKDYDLRAQRDENCKREDQITLECLHPRQIRRRLVRRGWHDFKILKDGPRRIKMVATNYNGRRFRLVVSRCDGVIVRRRPLNRYWGYNRRHY